MVGLRQWLTEPATALEDVLGPVSALRELAAVAEAAAQGHGFTNGSDTASLAGDCQAALDHLGEEMRRHLGPRLYAFRRETLTRLTDLFEGAAGARRVAEAAKAMLVAVRESGAARAAWDDCVTAFSTGEDMATCGLRISQVREVITARGHDWSEQARKLAELVSDGDFDFARELASLPPPSPPVAVWVAFADAYLPEGYVRKGPIQFFSGELWPKVARDVDPSGPRAPELDEKLLAMLHLRARSPYYVWARVELTGERAREPGPDVPRLPPAERARELATSIVEAATFRVGGSAWRLQTGAVLVSQDGSPTLLDEFEDPEYRRAVRGFRAPIHDRTSGALKDVDADFVDAVTVGVTSAREAVAEVRWYEAAEKTDTPARLALHVRSLEHALPALKGERWVQPVRRYLRDHWVKDELDATVFHIGAAAASELRYTDESAIDTLGQFVIYDRDSSNFTLTYTSVVEHAEEIAERLPGTAWRIRRELRRVARATSGHEAVLRWLDELAQRFDTYLNRAVRQRNAILHGIPTDPAVVESVVEFVARLSAYVVAQAVHNVTSDLDPLADFERGRNEAMMTRQELEEQRRPVPRILWSPREDEGL